MAIQMMVGEEKRGQPNVREGQMDGHKFLLETTHVGLVLELRERNGYHDSDFYAKVWNPEKGAPEEIEYATTRGWTYPNRADVDATPEVRAAYEAWEKAQAEERNKAYEAERAKMPKHGDKVRVVKGRKVKIGTEAEVFWVGEDTYEKQCRARYSAPYSYLLPWKYVAAEYRVGLRLTDGSRVFTSAKNIEKIKETT